MGSAFRVGYAGDGYVWFPDESGDTVSITLAGCEAGPYSLGLNVAVDATQSGRSFAVNVNGVDIGTTPLPPTVRTASQCAEGVATTSGCVGNPTSGWSGGCANSGQAEGWVFAGCYISDVGGSAHGDPWSNGQVWPQLNWEACRDLATREGASMFVMENGNGKDDFTTSCGHMEALQHGNYHDQGHNGNGRAPDTDCMGVVDPAGHPLGGPYRFAVYAPPATAQCLLESAGEVVAAGTRAVSECAAAGPEPPTVADDAGANEWILVGCFVSDQDGHSHADPWSDGSRWTPLTWEDCRQKAVDEGSALFVMEGAHQFQDRPGVSNCGHMELIEHGNYHEGNGDHFFSVHGTRDQGHDGHGRAPVTDCLTFTDEAGHALGGAWRFAAYAQAPVAFCLNNNNPPGNDRDLFASAWEERFVNVQLGAGTNVVTLTETGGDMGLDFIEVTASDGVHSASRLGHAHITADNGFIFYVNGERVGAGGTGLSPNDPAFLRHGWTRTDFFNFEASCEVPTAFAIEGVDSEGVAAILAEIEHCGTTTRTSDSWKCGVPSATRAQMRPTTGVDDMLGCNDGTTCMATGPYANADCRDSPNACWGCCAEHGGRSQCPPNWPLMCAGGHAGVEDWDEEILICNDSCESFGGMRDRSFIAVPQELPWLEARAYCQLHHTDLASIHTAEEQILAANECRKIVHNNPLPITSCDQSSSYGDTQGQRGHTDEDSMLGCVDGTECLADPPTADQAARGLRQDPAAWGCCIEHGGRERCSKNYPVMCAGASTATFVQGDFNCEGDEAHCATHGGTRDRRYGCEKAYDNGGVRDIGEFATDRECGGWVQFNFDVEVSIGKMNFQQRWAEVDWALDITLEFSDGSSQSVQLQQSPELVSYPLSPVSTTFVKITFNSMGPGATEGRACNNGAKEVQFFEAGDTPYGCYIGLEDSFRDGRQQWSDGSPVEYVNWAAGEPNGNERENFAEMDFRVIGRCDHGGGGYAANENNGCENVENRAGSWNDGAGTRPLFFLCESNTYTSETTFEYVGCYHDLSEELSHEPGFQRSMNGLNEAGVVFTNGETQDPYFQLGENGTPTECADLCQGFRYMGLQDGSQCFCDNDAGGLAAMAPEGDCNMPCAGDANTMCGGPWRNSVYELGSSYWENAGFDDSNWEAAADLGFNGVVRTFPQPRVRCSALTTRLRTGPVVQAPAD